MNDAQLVEACLEGDHRAYAILVDRYRYPVFGLCLSYVKDFDAAEDAAQEVLIAAYLKLESLPEPQKFGPWLRTIAANQCRMWLRRQRRQVAIDEEKAVVDPAPSPAEQVLARERRQRVLAAVSRLSQPQQQAVVLFYLEGLSLKRIAAFLDVAVPTVEQRLYRARLNLKEEMATMVEENLQEHRLPEDFTQEVVQEAKEGRWVDAALLYEGAAEDPSRGWKNRIWYLKRACARYNRVKDMKAFVRCHRKARSLIPDEVDATLKLDIWWPPGLATAYPHVGAADEVLSELSAVEEAMEEEWTIYGRFVFHFARSLVYRELENWDKMIDECTQFLVWAENLSETDSSFQQIHISIDEDGSPELAGESGRCYCACTVLMEGIVPAERKLGRDPGNTLDDSDRWLTRYEKLYQSTQCESDGNPNDQSLHALAATYKNRVATCYGKAAVAAFETGQTTRALAYFQQSERLGDKIDGIWQFYKAAALLSDGQTFEAKTCLKEISGPVVSDGCGLAIFDKLKEFDSIRSDPDIVELSKHWKNRNVRL